jgi:hypothetical protein
MYNKDKSTRIVLFEKTQSTEQAILSNIQRVFHHIATRDNLTDEKEIHKILSKEITKFLDESTETKNEKS